MHKVFISYHHENDQYYKERLVDMGERWGLFVDRSVHPGDIPKHWDAQKIRQKIRDDNLRDTSVTILLCGEQTRHRKHIDWELASSMIDGEVNKRSGILVITLPSIFSRNWCCASHKDEKQVIYPDLIEGWIPLDSKPVCKDRFPDLPERIIDNLIAPNVRISVCPWNRIECHLGGLKWLIDAAYQSRITNDYDLSEPRRKHDRNPVAY